MGSLMGDYITADMHAQPILFGLDECLMELGTPNNQCWLVHQLDPGLVKSSYHGVIDAQLISLREVVKKYNLHLQILQANSMESPHESALG